MDVCTRTNKPFRDVIGVRYSPLEDLPENPFDSEDDEAGTPGTRTTKNPGIFPDGFESIDDTVGYPFAG
jgi:hypothetical protein